MHLAAINKKRSHFYYHLNCRHVNDNAGDIKVCVMLISKNSSYACLHIKSHQNDANRRNLTCIWLQINKKRLCFYYHLNCWHINNNAGDINFV